MNDISRHIEFETLVATVEGAAAFDEAQTLHLADCAACANQLRRLENFFSVAQIEPAAVPQSLTANLLNIYQKPARARDEKSVVRRLLGALVFDDWLPEFAVQERFSFLDARQLLFRAGDYEIDLRVTFADGKCQLSGQIFPDCAGGTVRIFSENDRAQADIGKFCEFTLPLVKESVYRLQIDLAGELVEIDALPLHQ